jgi:enoyl-[acyl-carrier protein] reductase I
MSSPPTYLITGVANEQSIAWATARSLLESGASCYFASFPANVKRSRRLLREYDAEDRVLELDVRADASLLALRDALAARTDRLDGVLHSIAFAPPEALLEPLLALPREAFADTMDVSVYSLIALLRAVDPMLRDSSVVAMTYRGSQACMDGYGAMGPAKAALESLVRYLAVELGSRGVRVNSLSAGPLLTLSSSVFENIEEKIARASAVAPGRQVLTHQQVASALSFLLGPRSVGITGQCICVDHGLSILGSVGGS